MTDQEKKLNLLVEIQELQKRGFGLYEKRLTLKDPIEEIELTVNRLNAQLQHTVIHLLIDKGAQFLHDMADQR